MTRRTSFCFEADSPCKSRNKPWTAYHTVSATTHGRRHSQRVNDRSATHCDAEIRHSETKPSRVVHRGIPVCANRPGYVARSERRRMRLTARR